MDIQISTNDKVVLLTEKIINHLKENIEGIEHIDVVFKDKETSPILERLSIYPLYITATLGDRALLINYEKVTSVKMSEETFKINSEVESYKTAREIKEELIEKFSEIKDINLYNKEVYFNEISIKKSAKITHAKIDALALDETLEHHTIKPKHPKI